MRRRKRSPSANKPPPKRRRSLFALSLLGVGSLWKLSPLDDLLSLGERIVRSLRSIRIEQVTSLLGTHSRVLTTAAVLVTAAVAAFRFRLGLLRLAFGCWARLRLAHLDQASACLRYRHYPDLIGLHRRMLSVSIRALARALGVSWFTAWFIVFTPWWIPRPELLRRICTLLMVPEEWLEHGGDYGDEYTTARLQWYQDHDIFAATAAMAIRKKSPQARASALQQVEERRRKQLATPREGGRHG